MYVCMHIHVFTCVHVHSVYMDVIIMTDSLCIIIVLLCTSIYGIVDPVFPVFMMWQ